jgi:predicted XRE-type DNA-binding protein
MSKRHCREDSFARPEPSSESARRPYRALKARKRRLVVEVGSGNVFADLGFPDADELHFKLTLAVQVIRLIDARSLSLASAAALLKVTRPKLQALMSYRLDELSPEELMSFRSVLNSAGNLK